MAVSVSKISGLTASAENQKPTKVLGETANSNGTVISVGVGTTIGAGNDYTIPTTKAVKEALPVFTLSGSTLTITNV